MSKEQNYSVSASLAPAEEDIDTDTLTEEDKSLEEELGITFATENPYNVLVWDDPVNTMVYVEFVFRKHFKHSKKKAHKLMMTVHIEGKAAVWSGGKEEAENHVQVMHRYGLQSTIEQAG